MIKDSVIIVTKNNRYHSLGKDKDKTIYNLYKTIFRYNNIKKENDHYLNSIISTDPNNIYVILSDPAYAFIPNELSPYQYQFLEELNEYNYDILTDNVQGKSIYLKNNIKHLKQRIKPFNFLIENEKDQTKKIKEIIYQSKYFNLENVYYKDNLDLAILITKNKLLAAYKRNIEHEDLFLEFSDLLYHDRNKILEETTLGRSKLSTIEYTHPENIYIEVCSDVPSLVQMPSKLTKYQIKMLKKYYDILNKYAFDYENNIRKPLNDELGFYTDLFDTNVSLIDTGEDIKLDKLLKGRTKWIIKRNFIIT